MTPERRLSELLTDLFTAGELRRWLLGRVATSHLGRDVSFDGAPSEIAFRVVEALAARSLLDDAFFADLCEERDRRVREIQAVAADWKQAPVGSTSSDPRDAIRVLHLSDLHASDQTEWDARPLLVRLEDAVRELRAAGLGPDVVAITGDLAHSGKPAEYGRVARWLTEDLLPAAGLGPDALLVVPGNHDVTRSRCGSVAVVALEQALRRGDAAAVASVRRDPLQMGLIYVRYGAYLSFLKKLGVPHAAAPTWSLRREIRGVSVRFAGLDTAWLASGEDMKGRLVLGLDAINATLPARRDADLVVALAHHPLSWLAEWDARDVTAPLYARADLLLRGHLHAPAWSVVQTPQQQLIELPAGACYQGSAWSNHFQLLELDPAHAEIRGHLRVWSADHDAWIPDRNRLPPDGVARLPLRVPAR